MAASAKETLRLLDAMSTPFLLGKGKKQRRCGGTASKRRSGVHSGSATPPCGIGLEPRTPVEQPPVAPDAADVGRLKSCATVSTSAEGGSVVNFVEEAEQGEGDEDSGEEEIEAPVAQPSPPAQPRSGAPRPGKQQAPKSGGKAATTKRRWSSPNRPHLPQTQSSSDGVHSRTGPPSLPDLNIRQPWWESSAGRSSTEDMAIEERRLDMEFGSSEWASRSGSPQLPSSTHRAVATPRVPVAKLLQNPTNVLGTAPAEPPAPEEAHKTSEGSQPLSRAGTGPLPETVGEEMRDKAVEAFASRYRNGPEKLKEQQAAWRRQHDALVRKKHLANLLSKSSADSSGAVEGGEGDGAASKPDSRAASPERPVSTSPAGPPRPNSTRLGGRDRLRGLAGAPRAAAPGAEAGAAEAAGAGAGGGTPAAVTAAATEPAPAAEAPGPAAPAEAEPPAPSPPSPEAPRAEKRMSTGHTSPARAPERRVVIDDAGIPERPDRLAASEPTSRRYSLNSEATGSLHEPAVSRGGQCESGGQHPESSEAQPHHGARAGPRKTATRGESIHGVSFLATMGVHLASHHTGGRMSESNGSPSSHTGATVGYHKLEGLSIAPSLLGRKEPRSSDFNCAVNVARRHKLPLEEVRMRRQEFLSYALDEEGEMPQAEFRDVVRKYCGIEAGAEIPAHLLRQHDQSSASLTFEDFLLWTVVTAWLPERLVSDPEERRLRQIARDNNLCITDVERIKATFDKFDADGSGVIEEKEFRNLVLMLMNVKNPRDVSGKRLHRYWCEVDTDMNGSIGFEEFLQWYINLFDG